MVGANFLEDNYFTDGKTVIKKNTDIVVIPEIYFSSRRESYRRKIFLKIHLTPPKSGSYTALLVDEGRT